MGCRRILRAKNKLFVDHQLLRNVCGKRVGDRFRFRGNQPDEGGNSDATAIVLQGGFQGCAGHRVVGIPKPGEGGSERVIAGKEPDGKTQLPDGLGDELKQNSGRLLDFVPNPLLRVIAGGGPDQEERGRLGSRQEQQKDRDQASPKAGEERSQRYPPSRSSGGVREKAGRNFNTSST